MTQLGIRQRWRLPGYGYGFGIPCQSKFKTLFAYHIFFLQNDQISPTLRTPARAILANATVAILLSLIGLVGSIVFTAVLSFIPLALYLSYFITIAVFLHYRINNRNKNVPYGPWQLGRLGIPINIVALCFCVFLIVFLPFPLVMPVTAATLNYAGPALAALFVVILVSWFGRAKSYFRGPIVGVAVDSGDGHGAFTVFSREEWLASGSSS